MEIHLKYDIHLACNVILQEHLMKLEIPFCITAGGSVEIIDLMSEEQSEMLKADLKKYGIELIDNSLSYLVQQIKDVIHEVVCRNNRPSHFRFSEYISDKLNLSYSYLSKIFSKEMGCSVGNYMIVQRVECVKQLINEKRMTITEIAWKLNYSSVPHLSNQFKKVTGVTPAIYQRILNDNKRRMNNHRKEFDYEPAQKEITLSRYR